MVEQSAAAKLGDDEEQGILKGAGWHFIQVLMIYVQWGHRGSAAELRLGWLMKGQLRSCIASFPAAASHLARDSSRPALVGLSCSCRVSCVPNPLNRSITRPT